MSFNFTDADITKFKGLTAAQKANVIKEIFKPMVPDAAGLVERVSNMVNSPELCPHQKQKIKDALTTLGL